MDTIHIPFSDIPQNVRGQSIERKLFVYKIFSISACIVGTAVYIHPVDPNLSSDNFGIFAPGFLTGYIIINTSEILAMYIEEPHVFLEIFFALIGSIGSGVCCFYQFHSNIDWSAFLDFPTSLKKSNHIRKLILGLAFVVNMIALLLVVLIRGIEKRLSRLPTGSGQGA